MMPSVVPEPGQAMDSRRGWPGPTRFRLVLCCLAVSGMLPYLVLKTLWLSGIPVGIVDLSLNDDALLTGINAATFGMEVVAVVAALALTFRWGMRLPPWLVLFPLWVAAGLLGHRVLGLPLSAVSSLVAGGPNTSSTLADLAEPWVFVVVPLGFALQGGALAAAFWHYCRIRWGAFLRAGTGRSQTWPTGSIGPIESFQVVTVRACGGLAGVVVLLYLLAAVMSPRGVRFWIAAGYEVGWLALAVGGSLLLAGRFGRASRPRWVPLALVLVATGSLVWWGVWYLVNNLIGSVVGGNSGSPWYDVAMLGGVCVGLVLAMTASFAVAASSGDTVRGPAEGESPPSGQW